MDKNNDTPEFLFEAKNVRKEFVSKAHDDWWLRIEVERVVFEDILIMYDQMIERLAALQSVTLDLDMDARISLHLEKEPVNFFLSNILRYLSPENMKILSDNLIERLLQSVTLVEEKEPENPFSMDRIIAYMERTKEEDWLLEKVRSKDGTKHCFFSHLFNMGGSFLWEIFEEMYATTYMIYPVNDGKNEKYQQPTAKERVIAYLKDLRDGKEQTTHQMMEEEYANFKNSKQ